MYKMKTLLTNSNRKTLARINLEERIQSFCGLPMAKYQIHRCDLINILLLIKKECKYIQWPRHWHNPQVFISSHIYKQKPPPYHHHHHPQHPPLTPAFTFPLSPNAVKGSEATPSILLLPSPSASDLNTWREWQNQSAHSTFSDWAPRDIQWRDFMALQWIQKAMKLKKKKQQQTLNTEQ